MTNIERNADVVEMATYAPLFAHVEGWQWRPDMIWYDNSRSVRTASYYVQQLFSHNKGTNTASLTMDGKAIAGNEDQAGLFASAVYDATANAYIVKAANVSDTAQSVTISLDGLASDKQIASASITTLHCDNPDADNTLDAPETVVPETHELANVSGSKFNTTLNAQTFYVIRLALK